MKTKVQQNRKYFSIGISPHCAILQQSKKHKRSSAFEKMISLDPAVAKKNIARYLKIQAPFSGAVCIFFAQAQDDYFVLR